MSDSVQISFRFPREFYKKIFTGNEKNQSVFIRNLLLEAAEKKNLEDKINTLGTDLKRLENSFATFDTKIQRLEKKILFLNNLQILTVEAGFSKSDLGKKVIEEAIKKTNSEA